MMLVIARLWVLRKVQSGLVLAVLLSMPPRLLFCLGPLFPLLLKVLLLVLLLLLVMQVLARLLILAILRLATKVVTLVLLVWRFI